MYYYNSIEYEHGWHIDDGMRAELLECATELVYETSNTLEEAENLTEEEFQRLDKELFSALNHLEFTIGEYVDDSDVRAEYEELENLCADALDYIK